ncbi:hypothetical protein CSUB01_10222 [Colletotrichum sublineola]|uniref:Uncharacterized protein n=1 Tax=Colletotrichum sublineola TaxID=1173701 RepID=A0A066XJU6_COLSU|nr:hypothetical protein CSUB01_10222 [Colletotrichum sublineola]
MCGAGDLNAFFGGFKNGEKGLLAAFAIAVSAPGGKEDAGAEVFANGRYKVTFHANDVIKQATITLGTYLLSKAYGDAAIDSVGVNGNNNNTNSTSYSPTPHDVAGRKLHISGPACYANTVSPLIDNKVALIVKVDVLYNSSNSTYLSFLFLSVLGLAASTAPAFRTSPQDVRQDGRRFTPAIL